MGAIDCAQLGYQLRSAYVEEWRDPGSLSRSRLASGPSARSLFAPPAEVLKRLYCG